MFTLDGYRFTRDEKEIGGRIWFVCKGYKATPKAKYSPEKFLFGYRFKTPEERDSYLEKYIANLTANINSHKAYIQSKLDAKKALVNPFKVGDLLYDSWGYDQTNIDFYQVVGVGAKSVKIRPIASKYLRGDGYMSEYVGPAKDQFTGEAETKIIQVSIYRDQVRMYISSRHGCISPCTEDAELLATHYA